MDDQRRCYESGLCPYHNILEEQAKSALPRWVFVSAFGTLIMLALVFAGWHTKTLSAFDEKYAQNVVRFNDIAKQNRELLIEVKTNQVILMKKLELIDTD